MKEVYEKTIKDRVYRARNLSPHKAWRLLVAITKSMGPGSGAVLDQIAAFIFQPEAKGGWKAAIVKAAATGASFEDAIGAIVKGLDEKIIADAMSQLVEVSTVEVEGAEKPLKSVFDDHFTGRVGELMEWFVFALTSQYEDFFESLRAAFGK